MDSTHFLLDTNICVFFLRGRYSIDRKIADIGIENCCISEITRAELLYGAYCSDFPTQNIELVKNLCEMINVLPISETLDIYASKKAELRRQGLPIDDFDLLIGSAAIANRCVLVTDNIRHFERLGIKMENWVKR